MLAPCVSLELPCNLCHSAWLLHSACPNRLEDLGRVGITGNPCICTSAHNLNGHVKTSWLQYLEELMSTRLGVKRNGEVVEADQRVGPDGKEYYDIQVLITAS